MKSLCSHYMNEIFETKQANIDVINLEEIKPRLDYLSNNQ